MSPFIGVHLDTQVMNLFLPSSIPIHMADGWAVSCANKNGGELLLDKIPRLTNGEHSK